MATLRDDKTRFLGRRLCLYVILVLQARISFSRENGTDHRSRSVPIFAYSVQRVFVLKRIAVSKCVIPSRDAEQDHFGAGSTG